MAAMNAPFFLGIDGGGSHLRLALTDADLNVAASLHTSAASPSLICRAAAQAHTRRLKLKQRPIARYPPVIGAALLAKMTCPPAP